MLESTNNVEMEIGDIPIEESVTLDNSYPHFSERYFTNFYFIPNRPKSVDISIKCGHNVSENEEKSEIDTNMCEEVLESNVEDKKKFPVNPRKKAKYQKREEEEESMAQFDSSGHTLVKLHSNKLCLVYVSHLHPIRRDNKKVIKVDFDMGKLSRLENTISGKSKKGAQRIGLKSPMCNIHCEDGSSYTLLAGCVGKLVEVNDHLLRDPSLISRAPEAEGYVAIVLPPLTATDFLQKSLYNEEEYKNMSD